MKILILLALSLTAGAQYSIDSVIDTLVRVESSGNSKAIGDDGRAVGLLQLWKTRVDDINRICKRNGYTYRFTYQDRLDAKKSRIMCRIALMDFMERYKARNGKLPNEYILAHSWNRPYHYSIQNFNYIKKYKGRKET